MNPLTLEDMPDWMRAHYRLHGIWLTVFSWKNECVHQCEAVLASYPLLKPRLYFGIHVHLGQSCSRKYVEWNFVFICESQSPCKHPVLTELQRVSKHSCTYSAPYSGTVRSSSPAFQSLPAPLKSKTGVPQSIPRQMEIREIVLVCAKDFETSAYVDFPQEFMENIFCWKK